MGDNEADEQELRSRQASNAFQYQQLMAEALRKARYEDALYFAEKGAQMDPSNGMLKEFLNLLQEKNLAAEDSSDEDNTDDAEDTPESDDSSAQGSECSSDLSESNQMCKQQQDEGDSGIESECDDTVGGDDDNIQASESVDSPSPAGQQILQPTGIRLDASNSTLSHQERQHLRSCLQNDAQRLQSLQLASNIIEKDSLLKA